MGSGTAAAALVFVGLLLVVLGIVGAAFQIVVLGVVALIAAGVIQALSARRP